MNVDFSQLAKPEMIEVLDYEDLLNERKEALVQLWQEEADRQHVRTILARQSEPLTKFLQENVYRELILRHRINTAAQATLLAFATESDLDAVAANFDVQRLVIVPATKQTSAVMESDEDLRKRTQMKFEALNTAGSENSYHYHTLSADGRVADVSVTSPTPAEVIVSILQKDSEKNQANSDLVTIINNALNAENVRPLADRVIVKSAEIIDYEIEAQLYISKEPQTATLLENAYNSITSYTKDQKRIGRSVYLSAIYASLHIKGVDKVVITKPTSDIILTNTQASYCTNIKLMAAPQ